MRTNRFRMFWKTKDGGPDSHVTAYWLIAWKRLFSIVLLKFEHGTREAYHTHAFNCVSWLLRGELSERVWKENHFDDVVYYKPSLWPMITRRSTKHKVRSNGTSWVLSFRGPWLDTWEDYDCSTGVTKVLTHGRKVVKCYS